MSRPIKAALGVALCAGALVGITPSPASAGVVLSSSGTTITATVTGDASLNITCSGGQTVINGVQPAPPVGCAVLTKVTVNGDGGGQTVRASSLVAPTFAAAPFLQASLGAGSDTVVDSPQADVLDLGADADALYVSTSGVANTSANLGTGSNTFAVSAGIPLNTISVTSAGPTSSVRVVNALIDRTYTATNVTNQYVNGGSGNDVITATGVTAASTISYLSLDGESGTNTMTTGTKGASFFASGGSGTFNGGPGNDTFWLSSPSTVAHGGGGTDTVYDQDGATSGRSYDTAAGTATWYAQYRGGDAVARVRPAPGGKATLVGSLVRPGISTLVPQVVTIGANFNNFGEKRDLSLLDVVIPGPQVTNGNGDEFDDDLADITVPAGGWSTAGTPGTGYSVDPDDVAYGRVTLANFGAVSVHGPWTNKAEGFAHRVNRDLRYQFLTAVQRQAVAVQLTNGTLSRPNYVRSLVYSDVYRGLDVDRIFRRFLKREADPSGRTYWINALRNGKSMRKFRAQLFGSSEYYTKAGSTASGFVEAAYQDVLGRSPDAAGLAYWVGKIEGGTERGQVANAFLVSTEARRTTAKVQFLRMLDRTPTQSELDTWMPVLLSSTTGEQDLIAFLASSGAYYNRS